METPREKTAPNSAPGRPKRTPKAPRQTETLLDGVRRVRTCDEVNLGFSAQQAQKEALRCVADFAAALETIAERSPFPGVCGRVCQHERFCEDACRLGTKLDPSRRDASR